MSINIEDWKPAGKKKPKNSARGAINIAIEDAERFKTPLIVRRNVKNGKIEEVSPAVMRRRLAKKP